MSKWDESKPYPMDFYATSSEGPWTPNHKPDPLKEIDSCCGKCAKEGNKIPCTL